ncbi:MAG TPA: lipase maturation factor family protein [candidate division Zixibacteria bacterium]|nr:lipase maturation factor family protein [candidate division Zixibacteria bacterium]
MTFEDVWIVRWVVQRALAAIYMIAFAVVLRQFKPLLGANGLQPVPEFLAYRRFAEAPSLFHWRYSDRLVDAVGWTGLALAGVLVLGLPDRGPVWLSTAVWIALWFLYLSIVNVGQPFYGFGWETMLLEAGFFAAFMGPSTLEPSIVPVLILRWMLFRTELGAGLIKLRHDRCWRDLTCLFYHYETQPLPNPLSWYFHHLPRWVHRVSVLASHFVQLIVPFGLFAPQPVASFAGGLIIFHQLWLIVSGNYSWLNWLTATLGITAFCDSTLAAVFPLEVPPTEPRPAAFDALLWAIAAATVLLSVRPVLNLFSRNQLMNYSYNRYHLVNTYGAFGSVTKERYEIVLEATDAPTPDDESRWREYEFAGKPGDPRRLPPQVAPYHLRLDWLMWFLPFSVAVGPRGIRVRSHEPWFMRLVEKLLEADAATLKLLRRNPFPRGRPTFVRALFYLYRYTDARERRATGCWWRRSRVGVYLPPTSLRDLRSWR